MKTVLIIDDEQSIIDVVEYSLRKEGYRPLVAKTGEGGLAIARQASPDLVILDIMLPDLDGYEVLRRLRQGSNVPVLMLTSRDGEVDRVVGFKMGADDYVPKPFSPRELAARVEAILRRARPAPAAPAPRAAAGAFVVEREKFRITFRGEPLPLSKTEYQILETLVRHPGRVFARNEILDAVFGEGSPSTDRTIDTHIKSIRKKIHGVDGKAEPIRTIRGVGYCLKEA